MKKKTLTLVLCGIAIVGGSILLVLNFNTKKTPQLNTVTNYNSYYHGNFKKAFKELLPLAKSGNTKAQLFVANLYSAGLGVNQNYKEAYYWYTEAAKQNAPGALVGLALMYQDGSYVKKDNNRAIELYKKAIEVGNSAGAKYNLALMYLYGKDKDAVKGLKLLKESAKQNFSAAEGELGKIYYYGKFKVKTNYKKAFDLLSKAAQNGDPAIQNNFAMLYYEGKAVKQDYRKAYMWLYIVANYGNVQRSGSLLETMYFPLSKSQKAEAIKDAKTWIKTHKEINFDYVNAN